MFCNAVIGFGLLAIRWKHMCDTCLWHSSKTYLKGVKIWYHIDFLEQIRTKNNKKSDFENCRRKWKLINRINEIIRKSIKTKTRKKCLSKFRKLQLYLFELREHKFWPAYAFLIFCQVASEIHKPDGVVVWQAIPRTLWCNQNPSRWADVTPGSPSPRWLWCVLLFQHQSFNCPLTARQKKWKNPLDLV